MHMHACMSMEYGVCICMHEHGVSSLTCEYERAWRSEHGVCMSMLERPSTSCGTGMPACCLSAQVLEGLGRPRKVYEGLGRPRKV